jgi:hypothetical protein
MQHCLRRSGRVQKKPLGLEPRHSVASSPGNVCVGNTMFIEGIRLLRVFVFPDWISSPYQFIVAVAYATSAAFRLGAINSKNSSIERSFSKVGSLQSAINAQTGGVLEILVQVGVGWWRM